MYESISKNNELENEMTLDMSYFWYSDVVDCCRIMMSRTMIASIGECRVGQTQHGTAKSMRNFIHRGAVMTEGIHFEYMI